MDRTREVFGLVAANMERGARNNMHKTINGVVAVHKTLKCDGYRARLRRFGAAAKDLSEEYRNVKEERRLLCGALDLRDGIRSPESDFVSRTRPAYVNMPRAAIVEEIDKFCEKQQRIASTVGDEGIMGARGLRRIEASAERWAALPRREDFGDA